VHGFREALPDPKGTVDDRLAERQLGDQVSDRAWNPLEPASTGRLVWTAALHGELWGS